MAENKTMDLHSLRAILDAEQTSAMSAIGIGGGSKLSQEREDALDYYMGNVSRHIPDETGRSRAVSSDVADTIDGLMPPLMDIFAGGDEVVRFNPVGPEDVEAAEQETDYINHVFMELNPGFMILFDFVKDALLSKTGIVKVFWEKREEFHDDTYYDIDDQQFMMLASDNELEIIAHTVKDAPAANDPNNEPSSNASYN